MIEAMVKDFDSAILEHIVRTAPWVVITFHLASAVGESPVQRPVRKVLR